MLRTTVKIQQNTTIKNCKQLKKYIIIVKCIYFEKKNVKNDCLNYYLKKKLTGHNP